MIDFSPFVFMSLMCVCVCSHQRCCSDGVVKLIDSDTDTQDVDGSLVINSNQIIFPLAIHAATVALQHRICRSQWRRKKYEFIKSLLLAHSKRSPRPHCRMRHVPVTLHCLWLCINQLDNHNSNRSGAVEQLRVHVRNLSMLGVNGATDSKGRVELFERGYGKDAAGIAKEAIAYGKGFFFPKCSILKLDG